MKYAGPRWETPDPPGVKGSYGKNVAAWAKRELGITLGRWQSYVVEKCLRYDHHGDLLARVVLLSTGRQNGKSVIVRSLFGWLLDEGRCLDPFAGWTALLAAAHDAKQARIIYKGVYLDLAGIPRLHALARESRWDKEVRLTEHFGISVGDLTLDTVTGQPGSARGLSAGAIAWDEMLTQKDWDMWEALAPTQSAQRSPIMLLTSTAGHADSVVLRAFYDRLRRQATGDEPPDPTFYGAWWESTDPDARLDWEAIKQANPALGDGRLTKQAITSEFSMLPPDSWKRERLNHFIDVTAEGAFNPGVWAACRAPSPLDGLSGPFALGVDIQPGWDRATICAAGIREDGRVGVEVYRDVRAGPNAPVTAARLIAEIEAFPETVHVIAYDQVSGASAELARHGESAWGAEWRALKPHEVATACMDVDEMIRAGRLAVDDPLLDAQISLTGRRPVGPDGAFRFSRTHSLGPIDAVMAMTLAAHGIVELTAPPKIT